MLFVFGGLPGTGKTTLARELARRLSVMYLRIDSVEQAIIRSGLLTDPGPAGYFACYSVAADNLRLGLAVVADSVNPLAITREAWIDVAKTAGAPVIEIEVICSDPIEHRHRIESRNADIAGHKLPTWQDVVDREYEPWTREHLVIDTATLSIAQAVEEIISRIRDTRRSSSSK